MAPKFYTAPVASLATPTKSKPIPTSSTTPHKHKLATEIIKPPLFKKTMDPMLLDEIEASHLKDVPDLLPILFPEECLPLPPSDILDALSNGASPLYDGSAWIGCPDLTVASQNGDVEGALVGFLRVLSKRVAEACATAGNARPATQSSWTAQFANEGLSDAPNVRKPDILLGPAGGEDFRWGSVHVHAELKSTDTSKSRKDALLQLLNGAYLMFSSQDNRRFLISLSFNAHNVRLYVFDRAGLVITSPFDMHRDPTSFVHVLTALMFTNDLAVLGYDTSIITTGLRPNVRRFIEVKGVRYSIVKTLFVSDVIRGRGTVCWHVRHGGEDFVIKDTWADASRAHTEAGILRMADGVQGIAQVVADVIVVINDLEDSTDNLRSLIDPEGKHAHIETRSHRRLVLTPFGAPLSQFASRKELVSIFIDAVTAHRDLYDRKILHRDISVNNVMLVPVPKTWDSITLPPTSPSLTAVAAPHSLNASDGPKPTAPNPSPAPLRRGLLIDVDYALVLDGGGARGPTAEVHRTGTLPFMAIEVLIKGERLPAHLPRHDLESLLYVLIWICLHYAGPCYTERNVERAVERQNFDIYTSEISNWVRGQSYRGIGLVKHSTMTTDYWEDSVLPSFAPYFEPLKPCVSAWRELLVTKNLTYDTVLDVLRNTLSTLDDVEVWSKEDDPEGYGEVGKKRKRHFDPLARINEEQETEETDASDERPPKISRPSGRRAGVQSAPEVIAARLPNVIRSMKPKQSRPNLPSSKS
ncbi:hypothetical protein C8R43DRAFT_1202310 [Mycena crocata]|nr:hypothetical protein C8R43DRAFT_1202310 [Mycena crocata]